MYSKVSRKPCTLQTGAPAAQAPTRPRRQLSRHLWLHFPRCYPHLCGCSATTNLHRQIPSPLSLSSQTPFSSDSSLCPWVCFYLVSFVHQIPHISDIIQCLPFSDWLISLNMISSRPVRAVAKSKIPLLFTVEWYSLCKRTTAFLPTHLLMATWVLLNLGSYK